jgi:hypothetical protein
VLGALDTMRKRDLARGEKSIEECHPAKSGAVFNMFKHRHDSRFERFYASQKHEVELTGKDGGPLKTENQTTVQYIITLPPDEASE